MRHTPRFRTAGRALLAAALGALALGATGCLSDPAAPRQASRLALQATVHGRFQTSAPALVQVEIYYDIPSSELRRDLRTATFPLDSVPRSHAIDVDITPCLTDPRAVGNPNTMAAGPHAPAPPLLAIATGGRANQTTVDTGTTDSRLGCAVQVAVTVVSGTQILDRQNLGPLMLHLGETTETDPIVLFLGSNPPTVSVPGGLAVSVDPDLVRIPVRAQDVDRNLSFIGAAVQDSLGFQYSYFAASLGAPRDSIDGFVYGFVPQPTFNQALSPKAIVTAVDTKGQQSAEDTVPLRLPIGGASTARNVSYTVDGATTTITFDVDNLNENNAYVEVLFRDANTQSYDAALLAPVCRRAISGGGTMTVSCPSPASGTGVIQAIVIPVDANGNAGYAGRSPLPG